MSTREIAYSSFASVAWHCVDDQPDRCKCSSSVQRTRDSGFLKQRRVRRWRRLFYGGARRLLALLLLMQTAGMVSLAASVCVDAEPGCTGRCSDEDQSDAPCAPFCTTCTCVHGRAPSLPPRIASSQPVELRQQRAAFVRPVDLPPDQPDPNAIFHPPRG